MKKILSIVLSVCMLMVYTAPAFAYSSEDAVKVELSDQAMTEAVGGSGELDATLTEFKGNGNIVGVIANRTAYSSRYSLLIKWGSGVVDTVIADGTLNAGEAKIISGNTTHTYDFATAVLEVINNQNGFIVATDSIAR